MRDCLRTLIRQTNSNKQGDKMKKIYNISKSKCVSITKNSDFYIAMLCFNVNDKIGDTGTVVESKKAQKLSTLEKWAEERLK